MALVHNAGWGVFIRGAGQVFIRDACREFLLEMEIEKLFTRKKSLD